MRRYAWMLSRLSSAKFLVNELNSALLAFRDPVELAVRSYGFPQVGFIVITAK